MKKLSQYISIVITSVILPIFSFPGLAKDCPNIPEKLKEVTVKDSKATLRTAPKISSLKGSPILEGDKLKVVDLNPTKDSEGNDYCWYQVSPIKDSSQTTYWIAEVGINEFPFQAENTSYQADTSIADKYQIYTRNFFSSWQLWLIIALALSIIGNIIAIGAFIFSYHSYLEQNEKLKKIIKLIPISDLEVTNLGNCDLAILVYFRKHEKANLIDLLSNLQCDEQLLRDRLLALQEEDFIELVEQTDKNNPIYKMC